jgi:hypothetical protein
MSKQLNRKILKVNNRTEVTTGFVYTPNKGYKSVAEPSIVSWSGPGRGVQGESVNSSGDVGSKQIVNKQRKPI